MKVQTYSTPQYCGEETARLKINPDNSRPLFPNNQKLDIYYK